MWSRPQPGPPIITGQGSHHSHTEHYEHEIICQNASPQKLIFRCITACELIRTLYLSVWSHRGLNTCPPTFPLSSNKPLLIKNTEKTYACACTLQINLAVDPCIMQAGGCTVIVFLFCIF